MASRRIQQIAGILDRWAFPVLIIGALILTARAWVVAHPQHNPWAPLDLREPPGWATERKIAALRGDPAECRAVLARSQVEFRQLEPAGEGACARPDRTVLTGVPLRPDAPPTTCAVSAGLTRWLDRGVQPAARDLLGADVTAIEHFGAFSCRRLYGRGSGPWSEHATGNAIDIGAFVLADGRRIAVLQDWPGSDADAAFLRRARDSACDVFGTVLSPDYNAAHRDHLHIDQEARGFGGVCR